MVGTLADLYALGRMGGPILAAGVILVTAGAWLYRQSRRSARAQGERLGALEGRADLERTRRQQLESVLVDLGVPLPYWPPDGPQQPAGRDRFRTYVGRGPWPEDGVPLPDDDQADDGPPTAAAPTVPPLPDYLRDSASLPRHRRTTPA